MSGKKRGIKAGVKRDLEKAGHGVKVAGKDAERGLKKGGAEVKAAGKKIRKKL